MGISRLRFVLGSRSGLLLALAALAGCGGSIELGQVDGKVTAGGQPLANVLVTFIPDVNGETGRIRSMGMTDAEGYYRLQTEKQQPGAVVGKHRVTVEDMAIYAAPRSEDGTVLERPPKRFPSQCSDLLQTPLVREVVFGSQVIDLELAIDDPRRANQP
jgi:hypothetical protein